MTKSVNTKVEEMIDRPLEQLNFDSMTPARAFELLFFQYSDRQIKRFFDFLRGNQELVDKFFEYTSKTKLSSHQICIKMAFEGWAFDTNFASYLARLFVFTYPGENGRFKFRTPFRVAKTTEFRRRNSQKQRDAAKSDPKKYREYIKYYRRAYMKHYYGNFAEAVIKINELEGEIRDEPKKHAT